MAAGYSRLRIFDHSGNLILEMDASTQRSWTLNNVGRCDITVPVYDARRGGGVNPQCSPANLAYGNYLLVEHQPSKNADGSTNGLLPPWVGIILPPQSWTYGKVKITAYSAEQVLKYRASPMPYDASGVPGAIFTQLILWANDQSFNPYGFPIQLGQIYMGGTSTTRSVKGSILEEVQGLITDVGGEWDVTPVVTPTNHLTLYANYYQQMGVNVGRVISSLDITNADPVYLEQGEFFNWVRGYSRAASTGNRNFGTALDQASLSANGLLGTNTTFQQLGGEYSPAGEEAVQAAVNNYLALNKAPQRTIAPNILDYGNDFSYLRIGNTWQVGLDTVGFTNGQLGLYGNVRITAMEYTELQNTCRIAGVLQ